MTLPTASTYVDVKRQLVTRLRTALANSGRDGGQVQVAYWWPAGNTESDSVFLGRRTDLGLSPSVRIESEIPTWKSGRKQRQETYTVELTVQSWRNDLNPDGAEETEAWAYTVVEALDDLLADDPKIGLTTIQWAVLRDIEIVGGGPFENPTGAGFIFMAIVSIEVQARLT